MRVDQLISSNTNPDPDPVSSATASQDSELGSPDPQTRVPEPLPPTRYREIVPTLPDKLTDEILAKVSHRERDLRTQHRIFSDDVVMKGVLDQSAVKFFEDLWNDHNDRLEKYVRRHFGQQEDFFGLLRRYLDHRSMWLTQVRSTRRTFGTDIGTDIPFDVVWGAVLLRILNLKPLMPTLDLEMLPLERPYCGEVAFARDRIMQQDGAGHLLYLADALVERHARVHLYRHPLSEDVRQFLRSTYHADLSYLGIAGEQPLRNWYGKTLYEGLGGKVHPVSLEWKGGKGLPKFPLTTLHCPGLVDNELKGRYKGLCGFKELGKLLRSAWIRDWPDP